MYISEPMMSYSLILFVFCFFAI